MAGSRFKNYDEILVNNTFDNIQIIDAYLRYITETFDVRLNFNDIVGISKTNAKLEKILLSYHYHNNNFCNKLKKNDEMFRLCIMKKHKLSEYCTNNVSPFYGRCHMGIEEFIFPIVSDNRLIAYICVGEFVQNVCRVEKIVDRYARKYHFDAEDAKSRLKDSVGCVEFSVKDLCYNMGILCNYISLYYRYYLQNTILNGQGDGEEENIDTHTKNYIIDNTVSFINDNYSKKLTLQILASNCYCNPTYLSHIFNKYIGKSIVDYINEIRIEKAKMLLDMTNRPITEIALSVGFNNPSYFSQVFKHYLGCSPYDYRR